MENGSIADIAAVTRPNYMGYGMGCGYGGFGMGGWEGLIALIVLAGLFGNGGFGGFGGGAGYQQGFNTQAITSKLDGITNGISDATYALNNGINGVVREVLENKFAAQQCCCETQRAIDGVNFNNAKNTCDIVNAIHAEGNLTRDLITQNKIEALQTKIAELTACNQSKDLAISQANQNAYLINKLNPAPVPAYQVQNPNCCAKQCGCNFFAD